MNAGQGWALDATAGMRDRASTPHWLATHTCCCLSHTLPPLTAGQRLIYHDRILRQQGRQHPAHVGSGQLSVCTGPANGEGRKGKAGSQWHKHRHVSCRVMECDEMSLQLQVCELCGERHTDMLRAAYRPTTARFPALMHLSDCILLPTYLLKA